MRKLLLILLYLLILSCDSGNSNSITGVECNPGFTEVDGFCVEDSWPVLTNLVCE